MTAQKIFQTSPSFPDGQTGLLDVLVSLSVLDPKKAEEIKELSLKEGRSEEEILKERKLVSEKDLTRAKAKIYNIEYVDLDTIPISPEAISLLPQATAKKLRCFPVRVDQKSKEFVVAMADPLDLAAIEFLERLTGFTVKPLYADASKVEEFVISKYPESLSSEVVEALKEIGQKEQDLKKIEESKGFIKEEKVSKIVSSILEFAIRGRASDIHIEPQEGYTRVRYRIDGILQEKYVIPKGLHESLVSRIKILSGLRIDEKRIPQDGRFNFKAANQDVDLRVSTLPTTWGEKIVMRLLRKTGGIPDLPELGLRGRALKNLQDVILRPHGIILICGPTGSGKTTTLYSIIQKLNTSKVNIMTLEDPIEYKIPGVNQVQVNPAVGLTFASGLRSFLRQDPNIILVGEIRDQETAELAIQASLTGHLVFSTLHTNDAAGALPRLLDMGAEPYLLASSVTAIVAQRVVRRIHDKCKISYKPDQAIVNEMKEVLKGLWPVGVEEISLWKGKGDADCSNTGYFGRIGIFEVMPVSEKISRLILERSDASTIEKQAVEEGMITLKQDGFLKVLEGITTVEEVLRVAQE